jgi:eukaryotic-like serine/threonine-protein kinase
MEPERWQKIERLCYSALNEEKSARAAFLERACAGDEALRRAVELLLEQHEKDDNFLEVPAMEVAAKGLARDQQDDTSRLASPSAPTETAADLASAEKISFGPYRLLQRLGEGGMGEVWLAEQSKPVRRSVALKLIKAGMDTREVVARFESERQALALMDHPAIAKVFDAGSTPEGRPYFAMEYVAGLPITAYCDKHRMTTRQRMELFIQVCEGVQHAHQKAIIHRDLKPSNILVSEVDGKPMPRIIDFGLAKATSQRLTDGSMYTRVGTLMGTLEYMSPEQADSAGEDIDTRTDVYSLGVVLYQLLVGALPLDLKKLAYDEMLRLLRDKDVPKPSSRILAQDGDSAITAKNRGTDAPSLTRQLRGDPDAVVLKALEKDRKRRYASPSELAADLGRYLRNEPVSAHTPSAAYRARKYIRRHRLGVAVASGLLAILPAFAVVQSVQLQRTRLERDRANRERDRATRITDFMTGMFQVSDPSEQRGNSVTAREILDKASNDVKTGMAKDPDAQAGMMQVMGEVYINLGLFSRAKDLEQQSLEIRRRVLGPENADTLASMNDLAGALNEDGHYTEAAKMFREEFDIERRVLGPENPQTLNSMSSLADALWRDGHSEEAEKLNRETLALRRRVLGPENRDTLKTMSNLALDLHNQGLYAEAEKLDREILDIRRRVLGPEHPDTLLSMNNLAGDLIAERRFPEAEKLNRETLDLRRRVLGPEHFETLKSMSNLGFVLSWEAQYAEAEKLDRETLDLRRRVLGPDHPETLKTMGNLAIVLSAEGRLPEAERLLREELDIKRRVLGPDNPSTAATVYNLGCIAARKGNRTEALSFLRQAVDHGLSPTGAQGMEKDNDLESLHGDSRFVALVAYAKDRAAAAKP